MRRTNIYLDEDQLRALRRRAADEGKSVATVVRQAVDQYLGELRETDEAWRRSFAQLTERMQSRVPAGVPPEEIEADITAARAEVRRAHRAARDR